MVCRKPESTAGVTDGLAVCQETPWWSEGWTRVWKEAVVTYFEVLFQHLPGGTEDNHDKSEKGWSANHVNMVQTILL